MVPLVAGVAHADESDPRGYSKFSMGGGLVLRDDHEGGTETTSAGMSLELAVGSGRFQYFVEGQRSFLQDQIGGDETRGGVGVRWLARQFSFAGGHVGIELNLEAIAGLTHISHDDPTTEMLDKTYPDLGFGFGWQIRSRDPRVTFRMSARAVFAQTQRSDETACRAAMGCDAPSSVPGFVAMFGFFY